MSKVWVKRQVFQTQQGPRLYSKYKLECSGTSALNDSSPLTLQSACRELHQHTEDERAEGTCTQVSALYCS